MNWDDSGSKSIHRPDEASMVRHVFMEGNCPGTVGVIFLENSLQTCRAV